MPSFTTNKLKLHSLNQDLIINQEKFFKAFHSNPAAMTLSNEQGILVDINESYSKLTGYEYGGTDWAYFC